jgi:hypothetical protein
MDDRYQVLLKRLQWQIPSITKRLQWQMDDRLLLKDQIFYLFEAISIISGLFQYIKHQTELGNH